MTRPCRKWCASCVPSGRGGRLSRVPPRPGEDKLTSLPHPLGGIGPAVLVEIALAIEFHVDVRVSTGAVGVPGADRYETAVPVALIDKVMAVLHALRPGAHVAGFQHRAALVFPGNRLARQHDPQFIPGVVPAALALTGAGGPAKMACTPLG